MHLSKCIAVSLLQRRVGSGACWRFLAMPRATFKRENFWRGPCRVVWDSRRALGNRKLTQTGRSPQSDLQHDAEKESPRSRPSSPEPGRMLANRPRGCPGFYLTVAVLKVDGHEPYAATIAVGPLTSKLQLFA